MEICPYCKIGVADIHAHMIQRHDPETHDLIAPPAVKATLGQKATDAAWVLVKPRKDGRGPRWIRALALLGVVALFLGVVWLTIVVLTA